MKNKYLLLVVFVLSILAIDSSRSKSSSTTFSKQEITYEDNIKDNQEILIRIKDPSTNNIMSLDLENYIVGVVAAEMPASFNEEALKAQAIAARTYAVYKMEQNKNDYDVLTTTSDQAYISTVDMQNKWQNSFSKYYEKIKKAVQDTKDLVMYYDNDVIIAYYFAISNGYTLDASVFGTSKDYLKSAYCPWDKNVKSYEVTKEMTKEEFCQKLDIDCQNIKINKIDRDETNHVVTIVINSKTFTGLTFRQLLNLRSTDFDLELTDPIKITTRGYGHGVGMSQYGANEMAKQGYTYEEILKYYYQDINLAKVNV